MGKVLLSDSDAAIEVIFAKLKNFRHIILIMSLYLKFFIIISWIIYI